MVPGLRRDSGVLNHPIFTRSSLDADTPEPRTSVRKDVDDGDEDVHEHEDDHDGSEDGGNEIMLS